MMKKIFSYILILSICCSMFLQGGCSKREKGDLLIYYINQQGTKLMTDSYDAGNKEDSEVLVEMFDKLQNKPSDVDMFEAIPDAVKILGSDIDTQTKTLTINFSKEYEEIEKSLEILTRAAVVLTITQLKSVDYVEFFIDGTKFTDGDEKTVGVMSENSFADISAGSKIANSTKSDFIIYFANEDYSKLVPVKHTGRYLADASLETYIIKEIIDGPDLTDLNATISNETKLVSAVTNDGICYVIFDENFEGVNSSYNPNLLVYSIVNSLCELPYVTSVKISTTGNNSLGLSGLNGVSFDESLSKNLDIIEGGSK